jgi:putative ABC transport system permease protein
MLKNYLKIALRMLWKNKLFSSINILGLSLSMAVGVWLISYIKSNGDTDHFHPDREKIIRILTESTIEDKKSLWATSPMPLASELKNESSVEKTVLVRQGANNNIETTNGDIPVNVTYTEPSFFEVFGFKLLSGNAQKTLNNTNSVLLSENIAQRIFGKRSPLGQVITFETLGTFTVAGVIQEPKLKTHLPVEVVLSLATAESLEKRGVLSKDSHNWDEYKTSAIYAKLHSENQYEKFNQALQHYGRKFGNIKLRFTAQPIEEITPWNPAIQNDMHAGMNKLGILTNLFLLFSLTFLAAFNYISLSLARAMTRAKEISIRKVTGAIRWEIIKQFLTESTIVAVFALLLAFPLSEGIAFFRPNGLPPFKFDLFTVLIFLSYTLVTGIVAGIVPAWMISSFQPIQTLRKMKNIQILRGVGVYRFLIVFQFAVAIMIMIFFVVLRDFDAKLNVAISSNTMSEILTLNLQGEDYQAIKPKIEQISQVQKVSETNWLPIPIYSHSKPCSLKINNKAFTMNYHNIDESALEVLNIKLLAGRNIPKNLPQNSERYILMNEDAAKLLFSSTSKALNKTVTIDSSEVQILGITPNVIDLDKPNPTIYRYLPKQVDMIVMKVKPNTKAEVMITCKKIWKAVFPNKKVIIYDYNKEIGSLNFDGGKTFFGFFGGLVMFIACLGILGIASYSVEIRTKELGVRKVLGASNEQLIWTISKGFSKIFVWAGLIGIPAGWFCASLLKDKMGGTNKVDLGVMNVSIGFGLVCFIGAVTVLSQTIKAGQVSPVKVLKVE